MIDKIISFFINLILMSQLRKLFLADVKFILIYYNFLLRLFALTRDFQNLKRIMLGLKKLVTLITMTSSRT